MVVRVRLIHLIIRAFLRCVGTWIAILLVVRPVGWAHFSAAAPDLMWSWLWSWCLISWLCFLSPWISSQVPLLFRLGHVTDIVVGESGGVADFNRLSRIGNLNLSILIIRFDEHTLMLADHALLWLCPSIILLALWSHLSVRYYHIWGTTLTALAAVVGGYRYLLLFNDILFIILNNLAGTGALILLLKNRNDISSHLNSIFLEDIVILLFQWICFVEQIIFLRILLSNG